MFVLMAGIFQTFLSVLLIAAGGLKLRETRAFHSDLESMGIGGPLSRIALLTVAPIEIMLGASVGLGLAPLYTYIAVAVILTVFTLVLIRTVRVKKDASCGCFGTLSSDTIGWSAVYRNLGLITVTLIAWALTKRGYPPLSVLNAEPDLQSLLYNGIPLMVVVFGAAALRFRGQRQQHLEFSKPSTVDTHSMDLDTTIKQVECQYMIHDQGGRETELSLKSTENRSTMIAFVSHECLPCNSLMDELPNINPTDSLRVVLVIQGRSESDHWMEAAKAHRIETVEDPLREFSTTLGILYAPSAFVVTSSCEPTSKLSIGTRSILDLYSVWANDKLSQKLTAS